MNRLRIVMSVLLLLSLGYAKNSADAFIEQNSNPYSFHGNKHQIIALTADAGEDQSVSKRTRVSLDGSDSSVSQGRIIGYFWKQTQGKKVRLKRSTRKKAYFRAPKVKRETILTFELTVYAIYRGKVVKEKDRVSITVTPKEQSVNEAPTAAFTPSVTAPYYVNDAITFTSTSSDSDGEIVSTVWSVNAEELSTSSSFTHTFSESGVFNVSLVVTDDQGATDTKSVTLTVTEKNEAPIVADLNVTTLEDTNLSLTLTAQDANSNDTLTLTLLTSPSYGTLSGTLPNLTYTPNANFNGNDTFTFKANDGSVDSTIATVTITVEAVNDRPESFSIESNSTSIYTAESIAFSSTITDIDSDSFVYSWRVDNKEVSTEASMNYTFGNEGDYTVRLEVIDGEYTIASNAITVHVEKLITLNELILLPNALTLEEGSSYSIALTGVYSDATTQPMSGATWTSSDPSIATVESGEITAISTGVATITASYNGITSNEVRVTVKAPVTLNALTLSSLAMTLRVNETTPLTLIATYSDDTTENSTLYADYTLSDETLAVIENGTLKALGEGTLTLSASVDSLTSNTLTFTLYPELNTSNFPTNSFSDEYKERIPDNATLTSYDESKVAMITGRVVDASHSGLEGVSVSLKGYPEYGTAMSDSNGSYVFMVEGGKTVTLRYTKEGYLTSDRIQTLPKKEWAIAKEVQLLTKDTKVTTLDFSSGTLQSHTSSTITDERGSRKATIIFNGITSATVTNSDGSSYTLTEANLSATEFTTPKSMPATLPPTSAFTYCMDIAIEGVADDATVTFDNPAVIYVENFLGFEVGAVVPAGYYDRAEGVWKASDNGVVVKLLDSDNDGEIDGVDGDGDNVADDLNADGSTTDEALGLDSSYQAGDTYWRVEVIHFSPWDLNWPARPATDAVEPTTPAVELASLTKNKSYNESASICTGSYVDSLSQVFHDDIAVAGTSVSLHYSSKRTGGYVHKVTVPVTEATYPDSLESIEVILEVAGKQYIQEVTPEANQVVEFTWDGLDILGNEVKGGAIGTVKIGYVYPTYYYYLPLTSSFGDTGETNSYLEGRDKATKWKNEEIVFETATKNDIAKGWTLSNHHMLFNREKTHKGNGTTIEKNTLGGFIIQTVSTEYSIYHPEGLGFDNTGNIYIVDSGHHRVIKIDIEGNSTVIAGTGSSGYSGDGGLATVAKLNTPEGIAIDQAGNVYIADEGNHCIRKVDTNGTITTIAGTGSSGYSGDGGLAVSAKLNGAMDVDSDNAGNIYIADYGNNRIRKVDTNGIITTVVGTGTYGYNGDDILATEAKIYHPDDVAVDSEGNIYIADEYNHRIRKVTTDGIIHTIAGTGSSGSSGDGGLAVLAKLNGPEGIILDKEGNLYIADEGNNKVRKVTKAGYIYTVAGTGSSGYSGDGGLATEAKIYRPMDIAIDYEQNLYIADYGNSKARILTYSDAVSSYGGNVNEYLVMDESVGYIFNEHGLHQQTIDLITKTVLTTFEYDSEDRVISMRDRFGNTTTINRNSDGKITSITSPDGYVTTLTVDSNNHLTNVSYEDNTGYSFTYTDTGLMTQKSDPNFNSFKKYYDELGRVIKTTDDNGGEFLFGTSYNNLTNDNTNTYTTASGLETNYVKYQSTESETTYGIISPLGDELKVTESTDRLNESMRHCDVHNSTSYVLDDLTKERIVSSTTTTLPSGLSATSTFTKVYDKTDTTVNSITSTVTVNAKTSTSLLNVVAGTLTTTSPMGKTALTTYDTTTLLTKETQVANFTPVSYTYDAKGRVTTVTQGERSESYTYDAKGNVDTYTDVRGVVTTYHYDIMGQVTHVDHPDNTSTYYSYDAMGNTVKLTTPSDAEHDFTYNALNQRKTYDTPLSKSTSYTYDKERRLTSVTYPSGKSISYNYSGALLNSITTPESTTSYSYGCGGQLSSITKGDESLTYTYDGTLVTSITQAGGEIPHTISYSYNDHELSLASMSYLDVTNSFTYDNDGSIISLSNGHHTFTFTRDTTNGLVKSMSDTTLTKSYTYNDYGEQVSKVESVKGTTLYSNTITLRDKRGLITQKIETIGDTNTTYDYTYDNAGRLIRVSRDSLVVESYTYDANGNRINVTSTLRGIEDKSVTSNEEDNLLHFNGDTYTYNQDGYLTTKESNTTLSTYTYNTVGNLVTVTIKDKPSNQIKTIEYTHNINNQRVTKLINGEVVEKYLWLDLTTLLAILDKDNNIIQKFIYSDSRVPTSMIDANGTIYYFHTDQTDTIKAVSDKNGNLVKTITYDSFGTILSESNPDFTLPFGFAGGEKRLKKACLF